MPLFKSANLQERTAGLRAAAAKIGMRFEEKDEYGMIALLRDFTLFKKGRRRAIFNILTKESDLLEERINIFDYRFTVQSNNASRTFLQTVFFIQSKQLALPEMLLKPEHFFHKVGAWLGMQDIDFEEHPKFSDSYLLRGEDESRIRRTMGQDAVIRFFTVEKNWCLESIGYYLILYQEKTLFSPSHIQTLYGKGMELYEQFKTEEW